MKIRKLFLPALILIFLLLACGQQDSSILEIEDQAAYIIEPVFEDFYDFLGGKENLGHPISPLIIEGQLQKQYLEAALMLFSPSAAPSEQYSLAPLGLNMGEFDAPLSNLDQADQLTIDGYIVFEGFVEIYNSLGGQRYVGKPLTGVRFSEELNRVEQYFENLGFYSNLNEQPLQVHLMRFGQIACQSSCGTFASSPAAIIQIDLPYGEPFVSTAAELGDALLGARIAGPYENSEGFLEVIYENMVLYALPDSTSATARPIVAQLGLLPEPLVSRLNNPNVIFYGIEGNLGHNIPLPFSDFIAAHGSFEVSGIPTSEIESQADGSSTQCFSNLCLRYIPGLVGQVSPLKLGEEYKRRFYDQPAPQILEPELDIQIELWEDLPRITSSQEQVVHASIFSGDLLLSGIRPSLLLKLPSGSESLFQFPPTDETGHTQLTLPPVNAQNGTLIPYELCIESPSIEKVCATDSYMIWGN